MHSPFFMTLANLSRPLNGQFCLRCLTSLQNTHGGTEFVEKFFPWKAGVCALLFPVCLAGNLLFVGGGFTTANVIVLFGP